MIHTDVCQVLGSVIPQRPSSLLATLKHLILTNKQPQTADGRVFCLVPESGDFLPYEDAVATIQRSLSGQPFTGSAVLAVLQRLIDGGQLPGTGDDKTLFALSGLTTAEQIRTAPGNPGRL